LILSSWDDVYLTYGRKAMDVSDESTNELVDRLKNKFIQRTSREGRFIPAVASEHPAIQSAQ